MIPLVAPCYYQTESFYPDDPEALQEFEDTFAERVGCQYAVAVNSGTTALTLALHVLGFTRQHIRIPTYSCVSLLHAVHAVGGFAEFVDSRFDVESAWTSLVMSELDVAVHHFGFPSVTAHAPIEDYTLSLGYDFGGLSGKLGVCSTHRSKMISTDRGGVVFGNDRELLERVRRMAYYEHYPYNGQLQFSVGMSSMQAALGVSQLGQLDDFIARRREIARFYSEIFSDVDIECPDPDCGSVFFRYLIAVDDPARAVEKLAAKGIEAGRGVYPPLHRLAGLPDDQFPGTVAAVDRLLSVPCHPSITDEQAEYIVGQVVAVCQP